MRNWDADKTVLGGNFRALSTYTKQGVSFKVNSVSFYLKKLVLKSKWKQKQVEEKKDKRANQ